MRNHLGLIANKEKNKPTSYGDILRIFPYPSRNILVAATTSWSVVYEPHIDKANHLRRVAPFIESMKICPLRWCYFGHRFTSRGCERFRRRFRFQYVGVIG